MATAKSKKKYLVLFPDMYDTKEVGGSFRIDTEDEVFADVIDMVLDYDDSSDKTVMVFTYPEMEKLTVSVPKRVITLSTSDGVFKELEV